MASAFLLLTATLLPLVSCQRGGGGGNANTVLKNIGILKGEMYNETVTQDWPSRGESIQIDIRIKQSNCKKMKDEYFLMWTKVGDIDTLKCTNTENGTKQDCQTADLTHEDVFKNRRSGETWRDCSDREKRGLDVDMCATWWKRMQRDSGELKTLMVFGRLNDSATVIVDGDCEIAYVSVTYRQRRNNTGRFIFICCCCVCCCAACGVAGYFYRRKQNKDKEEQYAFSQVVLPPTFVPYGQTQAIGSPMYPPGSQPGQQPGYQAPQPAGQPVFAQFGQQVPQGQPVQQAPPGTQVAQGQPVPSGGP